MSDFEVVTEGNPLYAELDRLKRERDALADALKKLLEELEREAKAELSFKVAKENFSDSRVEENSLYKASFAVSNSYKTALTLLAQVRK